MRPRGRPLSEHERAVIEFALAHPSGRFGALLDQLDHAVVTGASCGCGCASIAIEVPRELAAPFKGHFEVGSDASVFGKDLSGSIVEAFLWLKGGYLDALEVVSYGTREPGQLPFVESLER